MVHWIDAFIKSSSFINHWPTPIPSEGIHTFTSPERSVKVQVLHPVLMQLWAITQRTINEFVSKGTCSYQTSYTTLSQNLQQQCAGQNMQIYTLLPAHLHWKWCLEGDEVWFNSLVWINQHVGPGENFIQLWMLMSTISAVFILQ